MIQDVSVADQQDIAVFDWWVHNLDRQVGNTNLLWDPQAERVVVIDFNNAFDPDVSGEQFLEQHLFTGQVAPCFDDIVMQAQFAQRLSSALERLNVACDTLPEEWRWLNPERDLPADFDLALATTLLQRFSNGQPWRP